MLRIAYLSLGSNLGDPDANLRDAIDRLTALGEIVATSSFYETEPVEFTAQSWFVNCAVALRTALGPEALLAGALTVEQDMGRQRTQPKGPRTIDIDILLFGDAVIDTPGLHVPHPAMHNRRFVLEPLAEIAPDAIHPVSQRSIRQLLQTLPPDGKQVKKKLPG